MNARLAPLLWRVESDARDYMRMIRERRMLIDAILSIEEVLNDPNHGAYHSNLWSDVEHVLKQLKTEWSKQ